MLQQTIKFKDFRGEDREEIFLFNLSTGELTDMELGGDGLSGYLQRIMDSRDNRKILDALKMIISKSFGVLSDDGRAFLKPEAAWSYFEGSGAYEQLYLSFFGEDGAKVAADFVNGIVPADLAAKAAEAQAQNGFRPGADPSARPGQMADRVIGIHQPSAPDPVVPAAPEQVQQPAANIPGYEQAQQRFDAEQGTQSPIPGGQAPVQEPSEVDQPQMLLRVNPPEFNGGTVEMTPEQHDAYDSTQPFNHPTLMPTTYNPQFPQNPAV